MRAKVLKSFRYSKDGISIVEMTSGQEFNCREDIADGLVAEKYIQQLAPEGAKKPESAGGKAEGAKANDGK